MTKAATPVRLGVSACLLGDEVRFDGGHKRDAFIADALDRFVTWVRVCPEEEAGLGIPREPMRLVHIDSDVRMLTVRSGRDVTSAVSELSARRALELSAMDLDGFILKQDSPSCGPSRVKVYAAGNLLDRGGVGLFAATLSRTLPRLPIESEGRLSDPTLREHFVARVFAHRRWRELSAHLKSVRDLMQFHARHKLLLMAHSPVAYSALGRLVANSRRADLAETAAAYADGFMDALAQPATRARHVNVLQHIAGYFKRSISSTARQELAAAVLDYQQGAVPLIVPTTLLAHYVQLHRIDYLLDQIYLNPYPRELKLRNHV